MLNKIYIDYSDITKNEWWTEYLMRIVDALNNYFNKKEEKRLAKLIKNNERHKPSHSDKVGV